MKAILKTCDLKRLVKATAKFISKEEHRPMLQYIQLSFDKEKLSVRATALDGYKLSTETADCFEIDESFTAYIEPYLPAGVKGIHSTIELIGGNCLINIDGRITGFKQPDGDFCNVDNLISDMERNPVANEIYLSRELLIDALNSLQQENKLPRQPVIIQLRDGYQPVSVMLGKSTRYVLPCRKN